MRITQVITIVILIYGLYCGAASAEENADLSGEWTANGPDWSFSLNLERGDGQIYGNYCGVALGGDKIDCYDANSGAGYAVQGTVNGNEAEITFKTYYGERIGEPSENVGKAILTHRTDKELEWICVNEPTNGMYWMPRVMILRRE